MVEQAELGTRNRLLAAMSGADKDLIAPHLHRIPMNSRMNVQKPDSPIEFAYFPETAIVSVVGIAGDDSLAEIGLVGRDGVTAFPLLLGGDRSPHDIFVQVPGEGLRIAADDLRTAISTSATLKTLMLAYVQALMTQISYNSLASGRQKLEGRLSRWILMCLDRTESDELPLTHEFISVMLGVRRPGVTLALQALEARGLIRNGRGRIHVADRAGLEESASGFYGVPEREYQRLIG